MTEQCLAISMGNKDISYHKKFESQGAHFDLRGWKEKQWANYFNHKFAVGVIKQWEVWIKTVTITTSRSQGKPKNQVWFQVSAISPLYNSAS